MSTSVCWELTCNGLVSRPGGVKDPHPLNTTVTGDKRRLSVGHLARKGFTLYKNKSCRILTRLFKLFNWFNVLVSTCSFFEAFCVPDILRIHGDKIVNESYSFCKICQTGHEAKRVNKDSLINYVFRNTCSYEASYFQPGFYMVYLW